MARTSTEVRRNRAHRTWLRRQHGLGAFAADDSGVSQTRLRPTRLQRLPIPAVSYGNLLREDAMEGKRSAFAKASARLAAVRSSAPIYVSAKRTHRFRTDFLMQPAFRVWVVAETLEGNRWVRFGKRTQFRGVKWVYLPKTKPLLGLWWVRLPRKLRRGGLINPCCARL